MDFITREVCISATLDLQFDLEATSFNQTNKRRARCAVALCYLRMSACAYINSFYAYLGTGLNLILYLVRISLCHNSFLYEPSSSGSLYTSIMLKVHRTR